MENNKQLILAIETSCDETSAAVYDTHKGLLSNIVASQIDIHKKTGGVVPEVASRAHVEQILPVIDEALSEAGIKLEKIEYIAVTHAPGLIGSLLVGVNTAKTLAAVLDKPILPINHLEGHIYANFVKIGENPKSQIPKDHNTYYLIHNTEFVFPAVVLLVSGGHTSLILMKDHGKYKYLGETLDDAAGEAFDKVAKILGLPYPGGPEVSRAADIYRKRQKTTEAVIPAYRPGRLELRDFGNPKSGNQGSFTGVESGKLFPRSMLKSGDFNFSFSGLKTSVLYKWQEAVGLPAGRQGLPHSVAREKGRSSGSPLQDLKQLFAYEFEEAVVDILATKTIKAAQKYKVKTVSICGGVAANKRLREELGNRIKSQLPTTNYTIPSTELCGDNAAMIACCASYQLNMKTSKHLNKKSNLSFEVLSNKEL